MENAGVGWIAAIIIGGLAGWLAEKFIQKSEMGLFMNIVLGIVGAAIASAILSWFSGIVLGGWVWIPDCGLRRGLPSSDRDRPRVQEGITVLTSRVIAEHSAHYRCE